MSGARYFLRRQVVPPMTTPAQVRPPWRTLDEVPAAIRLQRARLDDAPGTVLYFNRQRKGFAARSGLRVIPLSFVMGGWGRDYAPIQPGQMEMVM